MKRPERIRRKNKLVTACILWMTVMCLAACGSSASSRTEESGSPIASEEKTDTGFVLTGPDSFDSADTPVVVKKNKEEGTITFLNLEIGRKYTLSVDGTTKLYDKYGEGVSLDQIQEGDIVDITFLKSKKHLTTMQLSAEAWSRENVEKYEINTVKNQVTIGEEIFKLTEETVYLCDGETIEEMDLNPADVLTFQGLDSAVLSVQVEKGHGYLRLVNDENFVGGWIEIGQKQIQRITEDMLLTVAEGSYQVNISHNGGGGIKNVVINRNQETTLDIGDLAVAEVKTGMVLFSLNPAKAELYIDGTLTDASQPVTLEYGLHQIIAKAEGYKSLTQYLRVAQESAGVDVVLDKEDGNTTESTESSSTESTATTEEATVTGYYKVYIDAPETAEVYVDGNYVGIAPCSFRKTEGSHVVTLRKTGYEPRSYTVQIDDEKKDVSYSFADLTAETVSGS